MQLNFLLLIIKNTQWSLVTPHVSSLSLSLSLPHYFSLSLRMSPSHSVRPRNVAGFAEHLKAFYAYVNSFYSPSSNKHIGLWL